MSEKIVLDDLTLADGELFHDRKGVACPLPAPLAPLADTHGHLTSFREHDPAVALVRAALAGVRLLVVPVDPIDDIPRFLSENTIPISTRAQLILDGFARHRDRNA